MARLAELARWRLCLKKMRRRIIEEDMKCGSPAHKQKHIYILLSIVMSHTKCLFKIF